MHAFPDAADLQFLIGLEVGQVTLGPWSTHIGFVGGGAIVIEGPFEHQDRQGISRRHQAEGAQDRGPVYLRELIQARITAVSRTPHCLTLKFETGSILRIHSELGPYENGQIHAPGREGLPIVF